MEARPEDDPRTDFGEADDYTNPVPEDIPHNQSTSDTSNRSASTSPCISNIHGLSASTKGVCFDRHTDSLHLTRSKKKHLARSLMRSLKKYSKFFLKCWKLGFENAYCQLKTDHKRIKTSDYIQVKADDDSEIRFLKLYAFSLSLHSRNTAIFENIILGVSLMNTSLNHRESAKYCQSPLKKGGFSKANQRKLLEADDARMFYCIVMSFLDNFKCDGNAIKESLRLKGEYNSEDLKYHIYKGYILNLHLVPFDPTDFSPCIQPRIGIIHQWNST
jgi:hypothetical protein